MPSVFRPDKRRAFTLTETLLSLAIFAVAAAALTSSLALAVKRIEYRADYRKAEERIAAVEAFLRAPAANCGSAIPLEPQRYRAAFGGYQGEPFDWPGPVNVRTMNRPFTDGSDGRRNNVLQIAYSRPSLARVKDLTILGADNNVISLDREPQPGELQGDAAPLSCKQFICFGGVVPPATIFKIVRVSGNALTIDSSNFRRASVQKNDEIRLFRAISVFCFQEILYTFDYSGSGRQPRLRGICDLRFEADPASRKLTVYVIARGDRRYDKAAPIKGVEVWPEEYRGDLAALDAKRLLLAAKLVMELPNCQPQTILNDENVTEAY